MAFLAPRLGSRGAIPGPRNPLADPFNYMKHALHPEPAYLGAA